MAIPVADFDTILARLDRSSPDALLDSLVRELATVHEGYADLLARVMAIEVFQSLGDRVLTDLSPDKPDFPTWVMIDAAFSLPAEYGFHGLEYDRSGEPYRWTGPAPAFHFEVMVDRTQPLDLRLRYSRLFEKSHNKSVRCFVDGVEVEARTAAADGEFDVLAVAPARSKVGATSLTFVCPAVRSPAEMGPSEDRRQLGLIFRWLKIARPTTEVEDATPAPSITEVTVRRAEQSGASQNSAAPIRQT